MTSAAYIIQARKIQLEQNTPAAQESSRQTQAIQNLVRTHLQAPQDCRAVMQIFTTVQEAKREIVRLRIDESKAQTELTALEEKEAKSTCMIPKEEQEKLQQQQAKVSRLSAAICQKTEEVDATMREFQHALPGEQALIDRENVIKAEIQSKRETIARLEKEFLGEDVEIHGKVLKLREIDLEISQAELDEVETQMHLTLGNAKKDIGDLEQEYASILQQRMSYVIARQTFEQAARAMEDKAPVVLSRVEEANGPTPDDEESVTSLRADQGSVSSDDDWLEVNNVTQRRFTEE
jgi:chromosome segregation ATPase